MRKLTKQQHQAVSAKEPEGRGGLVATLLEPTLVVEGRILEVLSGFGLAHFATDENVMYGINRQTTGVNFDQLREGQRLRCEVVPQFARVLHAELIADRA